MEQATELVGRFTKGDERAVREIVTMYSGAVRTVARSMLRSDEMVAEVVQETFVKAWRAAESFDVSRPFAPWLYSIARRTAIDVMRREGRHAPVEQDENSAVAPLAMTFERTWEIYEVRAALDQLPPEERAVMKMSFLLGLTHEQIADELDIPVGTVKSRTGRAKKRLVAALAHIQAGANQIDVSSVQQDERS